jgi:hypothetical protein
MVTSIFGFIDKDCGVKEWKVKNKNSAGEIYIKRFHSETSV